MELELIFFQLKELELFFKLLMKLELYLFKVIEPDLMYRFCTSTLFLSTTILEYTAEIKIEHRIIQQKVACQKWIFEWYVEYQNNISEIKLGNNERKDEI